MKKILLLIAVMTLFVSLTVYAAPEVKVLSVTDDIISISGDATAGEDVILIVLNQGYSESDVLTNGRSALQTFETQVASDSGYSFEFKLLSEKSEGSEYKVIIHKASGSEETVFDYHGASEKRDAVTKINSGLDYSDVAEVLEVFTLGNHELALSENYSLIADALNNYVGENGKFSDDDYDNIYNVIRNSMILAAYNSGDEEYVVDSTGKLKYAETTGWAGSDFEYDYLNSLSEDGKLKLIDDLLSDKHASFDELNGKFTELVAYGVIMNYREKGYGHIDDFFEKYEDLYKKYDIPVSKLKKSDNKVKIYNAVLKANPSNLEKLAKSFDKYLDEYSGKSGSGSGSGSSSGGGSKSSGFGTVLPTVDTSVTDGSFVTPEAKSEDENTPETGTPSMSFSDVPSSHWAYDYIKTLYEKGIVNGKSETYFAPEDLVTRAEFVKMIVGASGLSVQNSVSVLADVAGHWSRDAVMTAVENGIVLGDENGNFNPDYSIKREDGAVILHRAITKSGITLSQNSTVAFDDEASISDYAQISVNILKSNGIINGKGSNSFMPFDIMTRAEASKLICELINLKDGGAR